MINKFQAKGHHYVVIGLAQTEATQNPDRQNKDFAVDFKQSLLFHVELEHEEGKAELNHISQPGADPYDVIAAAVYALAARPYPAHTPEQIRAKVNQVLDAYLPAAEGEGVAAVSADSLYVETLDVSDITSTGAVLKGKTNVEGEGFLFGFVLNSADGKQEKLVPSELKDGCFEANLEGLESDTAFEVQALVEYDGHMLQGETVTFRTLAKPVGKQKGK